MSLDSSGFSKAERVGCGDVIIEPGLIFTEGEPFDDFYRIALRYAARIEPLPVYTAGFHHQRIVFPTAN